MTETSGVLLEASVERLRVPVRLRKLVQSHSVERPKPLTKTSGVLLERGWRASSPAARGKAGADVRMETHVQKRERFGKRLWPNFSSVTLLDQTWPLSK